MSKPANPVTLPLADYSPKHFLLAVVDHVATVTLNRPERKNPLTFESYRELTDFFRACAMDEEVKTIVVTGAGGNFSSGGDVFEIIGQSRASELLYTGRFMSAEEGERWGFFSRIVVPDQLLSQAQHLAKQIAE